MGNIRKGNYSIREILSRTIPDAEDKVYMQFDGIAVKMNSLRYDTFRDSIKCHKCGRVATHMGLDCGSGCKEKRGHFNLYSTGGDGVEILMTKGTRLDPEGYRTTCAICAKALAPKYNLMYKEAKESGRIL